MKKNQGDFAAVAYTEYPLLTIVIKSSGDYKIKLSNYDLMSFKAFNVLQGLHSKSLLQFTQM